MRLIITRHGETEENKNGILQGQTVHGTLSETGRMQAEKLALRLKEEKIDYVYSSDLGRAADTAKEIMKYHEGVHLEFTHELRERFLGKFEGKSKKELGWDGISKEPKSEPENAETPAQLVERTKSFLHKIISKHKHETVLIVAHGGINLAFLSVLLSEDIKKVLEDYSQKNTCVNIFEVDEDRKCRVHVINCVKHLE